MKIFLLMLLLAFNCQLCIAQDNSENRLDLSPYGLTEDVLSFNMRQLASHGYATQITYFDLNFVDGLIQQFMKNKLGMVITNVSKFNKQAGGLQNFTITYSPMVNMGSKIPHVYFKYTIFDNKYKHPIINNLTITGSSTSVINFFVVFWPTNLNFNSNSEKIAYRYLLTDKSTIRYNIKTGSWSIIVENTGIKSIDDYNKKLGSIKLESSANVSPVKYQPIPQYLLETLNEGDNYNSSNLGLWMSAISKKIIPPAKTFMNLNILMRIDSNGVVQKVIPFNVTKGAPTDLIDSVVKNLINKRMPPYIYEGRKFPSYKNYSISFMFSSDKSLRIMDNGDVKGNPYINLNSLR